MNIQNQNYPTWRHDIAHIFHPSAQAPDPDNKKHDTIKKVAIASGVVIAVAATCLAIHSYAQKTEVVGLNAAFSRCDNEMNSSFKELIFSPDNYMASTSSMSPYSNTKYFDCIATNLGVDKGNLKSIVQHDADKGSDETVATAGSKAEPLGDYRFFLFKNEYGKYQFAAMTEATYETSFKPEPSSDSSSDSDSDSSSSNDDKQDASQPEPSDSDATPSSSQLKEQIMDTCFADVTTSQYAKLGFINDNELVWNDSTEMVANGADAINCTKNLIHSTDQDVTWSQLMDIHGRQAPLMFVGARGTIEIQDGDTQDSTAVQVSLD
jgi:hypothetical protein